MLVRHRLISLGTLVLALTSVVPALAEGESPTVDEIKAAEVDFNRGREAYKQGSYTEAAEYFESADAHAPNDRVLELAIGARDKAGAIDRAATLAQLGLDRYPNSERMKKVATPLIEKAKKEFLTLTAACDEACNLIDGSRIVPGKPATKRTLFITPGDHSIRAVWSDDRGVSKNVSGNAGETTAVEFKAPPIPKKKIAKVEEEEPKEKVVQRPETDGLPPTFFFIGAGVTVALGAATVWSGLDTVNNPGKQAVQDRCIDADCELYKNGRARQLRTNILIGATSVVGAATAVVGILLTDWDGPEMRDVKADTAVRVRPWVSYWDGPSVGAVGRF